MPYNLAHGLFNSLNFCVLCVLMFTLMLKLFCCVSGVRLPNIFIDNFFMLAISEQIFTKWIVFWGVQMVLVFFLVRLLYIYLFLYCVLHLFTSRV